MSLMGIDYGGVRVGVALAKGGERTALPLCVLHNDSSLVATVLELIKKHGVEMVVVGESKNLDGVDNPIESRISSFVERLAAEGIPVMREPEYYSTAQASREQGEHRLIDASAAAIILQSYLDHDSA